MSKLKETLCKTCRHYQLSNAKYREVIGDVEHAQSARNYCTEFYTSIVQEATECCKYDDKRNPDLDTMTKMAYIMEKKNVIGFDKPVIEFNKPVKP